VHGRLIEGYTGLPQPIFPVKLANAKRVLP
jgi:hypothetical protein